VKSRDYDDDDDVVVVDDDVADKDKESSKKEAVRESRSYGLVKGCYCRRMITSRWMGLGVITIFVGGIRRRKCNAKKTNRNKEEEE